MALPSEPTKEAPRNSARAIILFTGILTSLSGFSTDVVLPAVVPLADYFSVAIEWPQSLVPMFALCFGLSQLFYGPASDKCGRRPVVAVGLGIFLLGCTLSIVAPNIETLLAGRMLQGFGAGAAPVVARAILRDTNSGPALAQALAGTFAIFGVGIIIAPLIGYGMIWLSDWRATFGIIALVGFGLLLFDLFGFRETNQNPNTDALRFKRLWSAVRAVLKHPQSRYFILVAIVGYCALFSFISNAPRLYKTEFGLDGFGFAVFFAMTGFGIILGQFANKALLPRLGILNVMKLAATILFVASCGTMVLFQTGNTSPFAFTMMMFTFNTSFLVIISNCATLTLDPHPQIAGLTSSLFGMLTNLGGAFFMVFNIPFVAGDMGRWSMILVTVTAIGVVLLLRVKAGKVTLGE